LALIVLEFLYLPTHFSSNLMSFFRPLISFFLVCIAVLVVSCSDGNVKAPTYSAETLTRIQLASAGVEKIKERLPELESYIDKQDWNNIRSFIHGPLGDLRTRLVGISKELLPADRTKSLELGKEIFGHLNRIDTAAADNNQATAATNYTEALKDLAAFNDLLPALPTAAPVEAAEASESTMKAPGSMM
jgi:photosystem II protein PsbQ